MPNLRGSELLIIVLLVVLLFGAKRLPDAARSVGRSLRIFKAETKGLVEGETTSADALPAQSSGGTGLPSADHRPTGASAGPAHSEPVEIAHRATPPSGA